MRRFIFASISLLIVISISTVTAIVYELPYEVGGQGDPNNMLRDAIVGGGTALSPPLLPPFLLAVVFAILAPSQRWWGTVGVFGLCVFGSQYVVGEPQEPIIWRTLRSSTFGPFEAVVVTLGVLGILLGLLVLLFGIMELINRLGSWGILLGMLVVLICIMQLIVIL